jgi:hypothetical protein
MVARRDGLHRQWHGKRDRVRLQAEREADRGMTLLTIRTEGQ